MRWAGRSPVRALALLTYEGLGLVAIGLVVVVLAAIGLRTAQRARQVV